MRDQKMPTYHNYFINHNPNDAIINYRLFNSCYNNYAPQHPNIAPSISYPFIAHTPYITYSEHAMSTTHPNCSFANRMSVQNAAISDTGATGVYIHTRDTKCLTNVRPCTVQDQIKVTVANGNFVTSTHIGDLILPSGQKIISYFFPKLMVLFCQLVPLWT